MHDYYEAARAMILGGWWLTLPVLAVFILSLMPSADD